MRINASFDAGLTARVVRCTPLLYGAGADPAIDLPAHVRAASGLTRVGGRLVVVQDDAHFVALISPEDQSVRHVVLPEGEDGRRQFDDSRGNKDYKLDLEACCTVSEEGVGEMFVAFGSGTKPRRERVLAARRLLEGEPQVVLYDASAFYAALRSETDFSGSEMNIEGAVCDGSRLTLLNRGNGEPRGGLLPVDATCEVDWRELYEHLRSPESHAPPRPRNVAQYDLGEVGGVRLGFTDVAYAPGYAKTFYSASAEASPDATRDGVVTGSAVGVFDSPGRLRWTVLRDGRGEPFPGKVEGLLVDDRKAGRAFAVVDRDDPSLPSELCEIELSGGWFLTA